MEFDNSVPIYVQVINKIKRDIISGTLKPGDKMPSTRDLAKELGINPNTTARVYKEMERDNLCYTKRGLGTYITESIERIELIRKEMADELINNFIKGMLQLGFNYEDMVNLIKKTSSNKQSEVYK